MANLAQIVNVLQAVILTEGDKMVKTPTYHVFDLYKHHQDSILLDSSIDTEEIGTDEFKIPNITESVSIDENGVINITVTNLSADKSYEIDTEIDECENISAQILTNEMHAMNTFENPNTVEIKEFNDFEKTQTGFKFNIPACSVVHFAVK